MRRVSSAIIDAPGNSGFWSRVWVDDTNVIGRGRYEVGEHPIAINVLSPYWTDSYISDVQTSHTGNAPLLARGLIIERISNDAFASAPLIINSAARDLDPGSTGNHSDALQSPPYFSSEGMQNWIAYNYRATELHCQGIFLRSSVLSRNIAFVNIFMSMAEDSSNAVGGIGGEYDHFLMWNCAFVGVNNHMESTNIGGESSTGRFQMSNASFRGNVWGKLGTSPSGWLGNPDVEWHHNHYISSSSIMPDSGSTKTSGDPGLIMNAASADFGRPLPDSPLAGRMTPLTPSDASGRVRPATLADVGPYQH